MCVCVCVFLKAYNNIYSWSTMLLTIVEENSFYADLRGLIGPKCEGSKAVQT